MMIERDFSMHNVIMWMMIEREFPMHDVTVSEILFE
jgi:hypothetical protein